MQCITKFLQQTENLLTLWSVVFESSRVHHQPSRAAVLLCAWRAEHYRVQFINCGFVWVVPHHVVKQFKCPQFRASKLLGCVTCRKSGFVLSGMKTVPPIALSFQTSSSVTSFSFESPLEH